MDLRYHQPSARKACSIGVFAALLLAGAQAGSADDAPLDIFIGTLAVEKNDVILTRCDLVQNRYILRDAKGSDAVAAYARDGRPAYGEVIGSYWEKDGHPALDVTAIDNVTPGRSCHLIDPAK